MTRPARAASGAEILTSPKPNIPRFSTRCSGKPFSYRKPPPFRKIGSIFAKRGFSNQSFCHIIISSRQIALPEYEKAGPFALPKERTGSQWKKDGSGFQLTGWSVG